MDDAPRLFVDPPRDVPLTDGAVLLRGFARDDATALIAGIRDVTVRAPFRQVFTPGGRPLSAQMSNCGALGWISDRRGTRYVPTDPGTGLPWPAMPEALRDLARRAAARAGWSDFRPEACLVNRYAPGARMGLHQDRDEPDLEAPIVSVSLGLPATFRFGGLARSDRAARIPLEHGDVVVWGGPARLAFHGVDPVRDGTHPATGSFRYNLTFRRVSPRA